MVGFPSEAHGTEAMGPVAHGIARRFESPVYGLPQPIIGELLPRLLGILELPFRQIR
jgi:hypothetical protein